MLTVVEGLIGELREVGLPVSTTEAIDAVRCLRHVDLGNRHDVRSALATTLVKSERHRAAFDTIFELYFAAPPETPDEPDVDVPAADETLVDAPTHDRPTSGLRAPGPGRSRFDMLTDEELRELVIRALMNGDDLILQPLSRELVDRHARLLPGQPVAGTFAVFRTLRALDQEDLHQRLSETGESQPDAPGSELRQRLLRDRADDQVERLRQAVEAEVRRRLVADRGAEAVALSLREALPEDVDFLTASTREIEALEELLRPLPEQLASAIARRRRHAGHRQLDFRRTVRSSMSTGGVPVEPKFRPPHPPKPELIVLADISGSVATFARFTLALTHAMRGAFRSVRSFVFVDGMNEVTALLADSTDIADAAERIDASRAGILLDGRSDYGSAFRLFQERWAKQVGSRSIIIILGDARSNYRRSSADSLADVTGRASATYWLNPERAVSWDTGDSLVSEYGKHCDAVFECRNVRQLQQFIQAMA